MTEKKEEEEEEEEAKREACEHGAIYVCHQSTEVWLVLFSIVVIILLFYFETDENSF